LGEIALRAMHQNRHAVALTTLYQCNNRKRKAYIIQLLRVRYLHLSMREHTHKLYNYKLQKRNLTQTPIRHRPFTAFRVTLASLRTTFSNARNMQNFSIEQFVQ